MSNRDSLLGKKIVYKEIECIEKFHRTFKRILQIPYIKYAGNEAIKINI